MCAYHKSITNWRLPFSICESYRCVSFHCFLDIHVHWLYFKCLLLYQNSKPNVSVEHCFLRNWNKGTIRKRVHSQIWSSTCLVQKAPPQLIWLRWLFDCRVRLCVVHSPLPFLLCLFCWWEWVLNIHVHVNIGQQDTKCSSGCDVFFSQRSKACELLAVNLAQAFESQRMS